MKYAKSEILRCGYQRLTKSIKYGDAYWSEKQ